MAKTKSNKTSVRSTAREADSTYFLKLVLYVIIGAQWVHLSYGTHEIPLPLGLLVGAIFAAHDHFKIDRKIEFAVLLVAMLMGFYAQVGVYIAV